VPGNLDKLEELSERGVIGFKAFMSNSGIEDFSSVDDATLREGMKRAAKLGKLVAVHAESESLTSQFAQESIAKGKTSIRDYLNSRPVQAEFDAIRRAIDLAGETKCALHIVHVSSGEGVALVSAAKKTGVNVSCETCPHYLVLTEDDVEKLGAIAKCAPPLRSGDEQEKLWQRLIAGEVTTVGSDHSPSPPDMKRDTNFFKVWGGISGVQHLLPLLLTGRRRGNETQIKSEESQSLLTSSPTNKQNNFSLSLIARLTSFNVAERFKLPRTKGRVEIGADADFALVNLKEDFSVHTEDLFYRHKQSPYVGRRLRGRVVRTLLRGKTIFLDGKIVAKPSGNLIKPSHE
jgi:allantoinase